MFLEKDRYSLCSSSLAQLPWVLLEPWQEVALEWNVHG